MSSDESGAPWPYEAFEVKEEDDGQPTWDCPSKDCDCNAPKGKAEEREHRVLFFDHVAKRMPGARCRVLENGKLLNKDAPYADGGSGVTVKVRPGARVLDLEWAPSDLPTTARYPFRRRYYLDLGEDGEEGVRRRLHNIGFSSFGQLEDNVSDFQRTYDKPVTGKHQDVAALLAGYHDGGSLPPVPKKRSSDDSMGGSSANAKNLVGDDDEAKPPQGGTGGQTPSGQGAGGGQQPQGAAAAIQTTRLCIELHIAHSLDPEDFAKDDVAWDDVPYDIDKLFKELYPSSFSRTWRYAGRGGAPVAGATLTIDELGIGKVTATTNERGEAIFDLTFPAVTQNLVAVRVEPASGQLNPTGKPAGPALTDKNTTAKYFFRPFTLYLGIDPTGALLLEQCMIIDNTRPRFARLLEASKNAKKRVSRKVTKGNKEVVEYVPVDNLLVVDWRPDWMRADDTKSKAERYLDDRDVPVNPFDDSVDRDKRQKESPPAVVIHETSTHNLSFLPGFIGRTKTDASDQAHVDESIHYVVDYDGFVIKTIDEHYRSNHGGESVWQTRVGVNHFAVGIETMHTDGTPPATASISTPRRFTKEQYDALIRLVGELRSKTDGYPVLKRRVVGHLDVKLGKKATPQKSPGVTIDFKDGTLQGKPTCPGPMFEWQRLEEAGVALAPASHEGLTSQFPFFSQLLDVTLIKAGTKSPEVQEIKRLLFDIGYSVTVKPTTRDAIDDAYDGAAVAAVMAFQRHYFSGRRRRYKLTGTGVLDKKKPAEGTLDQETVQKIIGVWQAARATTD